MWCFVADNCDVLVTDAENAYGAKVNKFPGDKVDTGIPKWSEQARETRGPRTRA